MSVDREKLIPKYLGWVKYTYGPEAAQELREALGEHFESNHAFYAFIRQTFIDKPKTSKKVKKSKKSDED